jgi:hypothetical protein
MSPNALHTANPAAPVDLPRRAMLKLADAAAVQIECRSGSLWITLDDDRRDFIVEAGERFSTPAHTQAIVYALRAAVVVVQQAKRPAAPSRAVAVGHARTDEPSRLRWPGLQQPVAVR